MARFIKEWTGVRSGEIYPVKFAPGDECPDDLLAAAKLCGVVETPPEDRKPAEKPAKAK